MCVYSHILLFKRKTPEFHIFGENRVCFKTFSESNGKECQDS